MLPGVRARDLNSLTNVSAVEVRCGQRFHLGRTRRPPFAPQVDEAQGHPFGLPSKRGPFDKLRVPSGVEGRGRRVPELRTPLTTLRSVGEVGLRRNRTNEEYHDIISSMLEEAQRLQLLVGRLLELATAEGGAPAVKRSELQIDEYVTACANELSILAEARDQHIVFDTVPCRLRTDAVIFRQALQNLIDNATKYSPDGSAIRVTVRDTGSTIEVSVTDEGPGISPEDQVNLTKRFFRPDRGRGRSSGGFGLGLSITKAYMRILGGELRVQAATPRGTTFRLVLPKA